MPATTSLTGSHKPIRISNASFYLHAPGIKGSCVELALLETPTRGNRMSEPHHDQFRHFLEEGEIQMLKTFEIEIESDAFERAADITTRSGGLPARTAMGEAAIVLTTPKPGKDVDSVVLYTDENGESRWIFPELSAVENEFRFHLPREKAALPEEKDPTVAVRGKITKGIRRIIKVIAWLTTDLVGKGALALIRKWEYKKRPYGFQYLEPGRISDEVPWDHIRGKRALMLLHGTFSSTAGAFDGLVKSEVMQQLTELYEGRIFSFNHPSMHHTPEENVIEMMKMLPPEISLNVDLITHSRGGLVGREICQCLPEINPTNKQLEVGKAIFVAGPHGGTILTNRANWLHLIDTYTNLITHLPDTPFTIIMEALISLIKVIGGGALEGLPGLQAMLPKGEYLQMLNKTRPTGTSYYAMGANYAPADEKLLVRFGKRLLMKTLSGIFGENSDMVVPTNGCFEVTSAADTLPIPAERRRLYELDMDTHHLNFFEKEVVNRQLLAWLQE